MRNRNIKINVFLNEEEKKIFDEKVKKSGLNKSEFFRKIILDYQLREQPDERFYEILSLLRNMVNNLNQMARTYNRYQGYMREDKFTPLLNQIQDFVLSMQEVYLTPQKKGVSNGYNKNMEIQDYLYRTYTLLYRNHDRFRNHANQAKYLDHLSQG